MNYLASPPLVVAYAIAGTMDIDLVDDPLGVDADGHEVYLKDIWPSTKEIAQTVEEAVQSDMFRKSYGEVFDGDERWNGLEVPDRRPLRVGRATRPTCASRRTSRACRPSRRPSRTSRARACWPSSATRVTTDHISPAGSIKEDGPAGRLPQGARRREARLQLLRLAARQPRGDDARHVRQHPPAQPARAGHRGRRDAHEGRRGDVDLRRGDGATPRRARRWSCSAARSTARARRATGRPRARTCSASAR